MIKNKKFLIVALLILLSGSNVFGLKKVFTQLTAAGSTAVFRTNDVLDHTFQVTVAAIDTSVDIRVEGSLDNTNWFNMDDDLTDTQYTANGVYMLHKDNFKCEFIRFTFVSEVGGAAATIDVIYAGYGATY